MQTLEQSKRSQRHNIFKQPRTEVMYLFNKLYEKLAPYYVAFKTHLLFHFFFQNWKLGRVLNSRYYFPRCHWCVFGMFPLPLVTQTRRIERGLLLKHRVCVTSDDGKSPNTHQWYLAYYTIVWELQCAVLLVFTTLPTYQQHPIHLSTIGLAKRAVSFNGQKNVSACIIFSPLKISF
jgi:hypothetical protein